MSYFGKLRSDSSARHGHAGRLHRAVGGGGSTSSVGGQPGPGQPGFTDPAGMPGLGGIPSPGFGPGFAEGMGMNSIGLMAIDPLSVTPPPDVTIDPPDPDPAPGPQGYADPGEGEGEGEGGGGEGGGDGSDGGGGDGGSALRRGGRARR